MGVGGASQGSRKQNKDPWEFHLQWKKRGSKWQENVHRKKYTPTSSPSTGPPRTARRSSNVGFILSYGLPLPAEQICIGSRGILSLVAWGSTCNTTVCLLQAFPDIHPWVPEAIRLLPVLQLPPPVFPLPTTVLFPRWPFYAASDPLQTGKSSLPAPMTSDAPSSKKATLILPSLALWPSGLVFVIHCVQALFPPRLWAPWKCTWALFNSIFSTELKSGLHMAAL